MLPSLSFGSNSVHETEPNLRKSLYNNYLYWLRDLRYGFFGDLHGNLEAFRAVLHAMASERIDRYLCIGDIVGYGADPGPCIDLVRELDPIVVAGNHDLAVIDALDISAFNPYAKASVLWCRAVLSAEQRRFLGEPNLVQIIDTDVTLFHSTLHLPEHFEYLEDERDAEHSFAFLRSRVGIYGHSHVPVVFERHPTRGIDSWCDDSFTLDADARYLVNPGSVGQPRDGDPRARFGVFDTETREVTLHRVNYDIETAQEKIRRAGLPDIISERLAVGY